VVDLLHPLMHALGGSGIPVIDSTEGSGTYTATHTDIDSENYRTGLLVSVTFSQWNASPVPASLNINGLGDVPLFPHGGGAQFGAWDIAPGTTHLLHFDGAHRFTSLSHSPARTWVHQGMHQTGAGGLGRQVNVWIPGEPPGATARHIIISGIAIAMETSATSAIHALEGWISGSNNLTVIPLSPTGMTWPQIFHYAFTWTIIYTRN